MKTTVSIVMLLVAMLASPFAGAAAHVKRTTPVGHAVNFDPDAREKLIVVHIEQKLGVYGNSVVTDPRFAIDPTMFTRQPSPKPSVPHPRARRYDYDYVFSAWSKEHGRPFLEKNNAAFDYVEKKFGVPREVIDGVLNIETQWGKSVGRRPVVTTLYTLAVMRPDRVKPGWPEEQLIAFLAISRDRGIDPFSVKGSSTGAFGFPQFEPTSYSALAVSCHGNNAPPDLFDDADAICSIGNYLHRAGWGLSEVSHRHALFAYNRDNFYIAAILDYADWLAGKQLRHPRYQFFHSHVATAAIK